MRFSERYGYTPVRDALQRESMDSALQNGLWSIFDTFCLDLARRTYNQTRTDEQTWILMFRLWNALFKLPTDTIPYMLDKTLRVVRDKFFGGEWFEVYDFVEFLVNQHPDADMRARLGKGFNAVLEREQAAYRIIDGRVVEITSEEEIAAIEQALAVGDDVAGVRAHLSAALTKMSDRVRVRVVPSGAVVRLVPVLFVCDPRSD